VHVSRPNGLARRLSTGACTTWPSSNRASHGCRPTAHRRARRSGRRGSRRRATSRAPLGPPRRRPSGARGVFPLRFGRQRERLVSGDLWRTRSS
jgi:hypothetical protein